MRKSTTASLKHVNIILFIILGVTISCVDFFNSETKITDEFSLWYPDTRDQMCLLYRKGDKSSNCLVRQTVYAVGYNEIYLIVKRHPSSHYKDPDKKTTEFYIVPRNIDYTDYKSKSEPENEIIGPMSKQEFDLKRKQLGIPDSVDFTIVFEDLE